MAYLNPREMRPRTLPGARANAILRLATLLAGLPLLAGVLAGCPQTVSPTSYVQGGTGDNPTIGDTSVVTVFAPISDLSVSGGTPIEVNWLAVATTTFASIEIIFDPDTEPENGNEILADAVDLGVTSSLLDTSNLEAGVYNVGVLLFERSELAAFDYASGQLTINQRPQLFFNEPRTNFALDRSQAVNPEFTVDWTVFDPDSTVTVRILLDPDETPNGNEVLLFESTSQTGERFTFNLPTAGFEPGLYRFLAEVDDGVGTFAFYSPASILLRSRLSGVIDLRPLGTSESTVPGAIFEGVNPRDNAGSFVAATSDIDGDGFNEFMIMSQFGKPRYQLSPQRTGVGEGYFIYGRADRFSGKINLNSTGTLFRGNFYAGPDEAPNPIRPSRGITSFTILSDWDGDGSPEFAFGCPFTDSLPAAVLDASGYFRTGAVVIASSSTLRPDLGYPGRQLFNLSDIGTLEHGPSNTDAPCPEGFYAPTAPGGGAGITLFHRHAGDIVGTGGIAAARLGCRLATVDFDDQCGERIGAYDFDSIIISVPNRNPATNMIRTTNPSLNLAGAGVVSIFYMDAATNNYLWENVDIPPATDTYPGLGGNASVNAIPHGGPYHYVLDDALWSPGFTVDPDDSESPCVEIASLSCPASNRTVRLGGSFAGARLGNALGIDDINTDGLADILVGSPLSQEGRGSCFIVFGRIRELLLDNDQVGSIAFEGGAELQIEELTKPVNGSDPNDLRVFDGLRILGEPGERLGESQASAGDFNGDGIADVLIGSALTNNRRGGVAILFGKRDLINLTERDIPYAEIPTRGLGLIIEGEADGDLAGSRVASAGDIDGDGLGDILIAAPNRSVRVDLDRDGTLDIDRTNCGVVYLVYGSSTLSGTLSLSDIATEALPGAVFVGRNSGDFLGAGIGEQGDVGQSIAGVGDVDGDGQSDLLFGSLSASPGDRVRAGEAYLVYGQ